MRTHGKLLLAAVLATGGIAYSAGTASAAIVCSEDTCWHSTETYEYPATSHVIVHPDSWRWADTDHYTWREHTGRGYWHGDAWEDF